MPLHLLPSARSGPVMTKAPVLFQLHAISALLLFAARPFTRLVRMLTAPLGYLTRPYTSTAVATPDSAPVLRAVVGTAWGHEQPGSESGLW